MKKFDFKKYLPTILIVLGILIISGFIVRALMAPDSQTETKSKQPISQADTDALRQGASLGNPQSKVVVTEFGDYQCPSCATWSTYIKDSVIAKYGDKILFVFKNFPLPIHKNAPAAAQAVDQAVMCGLQRQRAFDLIAVNVSGDVGDDFVGRGADVGGLGRHFDFARSKRKN